MNLTKLFSYTLQKQAKSQIFSVGTKVMTIILSLTLFSGCVVIASPSRADFHQQKQLSLDAGELTKFDIDAGAGSLIINGSAQATEITVTADIYTSSDNKDNYELALSDSGKTAFLVAKTNSSMGMWIGSSPYIDVVITVPNSMMLVVEDGSGELYIRDINGEVDINDGSGDLTVSNIGSHLKISDGSGELKVSNVTGNVVIVDGSGEMELINIAGDLNIDDGSGGIVVKNVSGNAVFEDGSGDLTAHQIEGTITLDDGSGDIDIDGAGGLKIIDSGSGALKVKNVNGAFEIDS